MPAFLYAGNMGSPHQLADSQPRCIQKKSLGYRHGVQTLHGANHKHAVHRADGFHFAQPIEHKILVMRHISHKHLDDIVEVAAGVVTFRHLFHFLHSVHKFAGIFLAVLLQANVAEHHHIVARHVGVHNRHIFLDISFAFQSFLPLKSGRWR